MRAQEQGMRNFLGFAILAGLMVSFSCSTPAVATKLGVTPHKEGGLKRISPMVRAGLGNLYPSYMDDFETKDCQIRLPDLSDMEICATAVGTSSPSLHAYCAHLSTKALIVAVTCKMGDQVEKRYARFAVRYSLELARDGPSAENSEPKTNLLAAIAIAKVFLSGQEVCRPVQVFTNEMLLAYARFVRSGDAASARSTIELLLRHGRVCLSDEETQVLKKLLGPSGR
jgi:hypothetical protein